MNKENTRLLGVGETIRDGDLIEFGDELVPIEANAIGELITGEELCEVRRPTGGTGRLDDLASKFGVDPEWVEDRIYSKAMGYIYEGVDPNAVKISPEPPSDKAKTNDGGKPPLSRLPWKALREVALVQAYGYEKYGSWDNWRKGMEVSRNLSCALRHITEYMDGTDLDAESKRSHLAHAATRILFTVENLIDGTAADDRK